MATEGRRLDAARRQLDISVYELWIAYVSLGGSCDAFSVKAHLDGSMDSVSPADNAILEQAINEICRDLGLVSPFGPRPR